MQILIVGCGNVGQTLVQQLSKEGHNITVIEEKSSVLQNVVNNYDVMGIVGNGASYSIMKANDHQQWSTAVLPAHADIMV